MTPGSATPPADQGADLVAGYIARWRPSSVPPPAAAFARDVIAAAAPGGQERAKNLLWAAAKLADYATGLGLDPAPGVLLHPSVIERFARCAPGLSGVARRTLRTNLRFIARRVVPALYPQDAALPRERAKQPYSAAEIAGFLALADAQPVLSRRMRAAGLVCPGAGAGLIRGDLRAVRGTDVICRSGGVIVAVRGARPRAVPVLSRYHDRLLAAARRVSDFLCAGLFAVRYRMFIRCPLFALSDAFVPGLSSGLAKSDLPLLPRADAACPGFRGVCCCPGRPLPDPLRIAWRAAPVCH